jgi:hypothetical protein
MRPVRPRVTLPRIRFEPERLAAIISGLALAATVVNALSSYRTLSISRQSEEAQIFLQFQEDYNAVAARFPTRLADPDFRPAPGSGEFRQLQEYWIFCFAEFYATHDLNRGAYTELWTRYYATLAENALDIPSLRYVLVDMMHGGEARRGAWPAFYDALSNLALGAGKPLPAAAGPSTLPPVAISQGR